MRNSLSILLLGSLAFATSACAEPGTPEYDEQEAAWACLEKAAEIPAFEGFVEQAENSPDPDSTWRVSENGRFVLETKDPRPDRQSTFVFTCSGNVIDRRIDFVQLDENEIRPTGDEIWSY